MEAGAPREVEDSKPGTMQAIPPQDGGPTIEEASAAVYTEDWHASEPQEVGELEDWRAKDRMKTLHVLLVVCLNIGVDPPDVPKINPCATLECWIDHQATDTQHVRRALESIGKALEAQYKFWQQKAVIESCLDPTVEDVRHACHTLRRHARKDRALLHYNGHGVPKPTSNGELWVFNKTFTQYIPLSTADLCAWLGSPGVLVLDCSASGNIIDFYEKQVEAASSAAAEAARMDEADEVQGNSGTQSCSPGSKKVVAQQVQSEAEGSRRPAASTKGAGNPGNSGGLSGFDRRVQKSTSTDSDRPISRQNSRDSRQGDRSASRVSSMDGLSGGSYKDNSLQTWVMLGACAADEILPQNPELPADVFTSCLTTPLKMALRWYMMHESVMGLTVDMLDHIPGALNDRKSPLGELYWIFTAVTDTIAWNVLPRGLFHQLFRQDLLLASLFRNFLLAERILVTFGCTPCSFPRLPPTSHHDIWQAWDRAVDVCLSQLPNLLNPSPARVRPFLPNNFFREQLTAFEVWLSYGTADKTPPMQLPIVLQVLLSQDYRAHALSLLAQLLDMGRFAVNHAMSVVIFPYILRLLQGGAAAELAHDLVFIWTKIMVFDQSCRHDLVRSNGHTYFIEFMKNDAARPGHRAMAAYVLALVCTDFQHGQASCFQNGLLDVLEPMLIEPHALLRCWTALCLARLWNNNPAALMAGAAPGCGVRAKLHVLLTDTVPEVRAAAVLALGSYVGAKSCMQGMPPSPDISEAELEAMSLILGMAYDGCVLVRREVVAALSSFVLDHHEGCRYAVSMLIMQDGTSGSQAVDQSACFPEHSTRSSVDSLDPGSFERVSFLDATEIEASLEPDTTDAITSSNGSMSDDPSPSSVAPPTVLISDERLQQLYHRTWYVLNGICLDPFENIAYAVSILISVLTASVESQSKRSNVESKLLRQALENHEKQQMHIRRSASMSFSGSLSEATLKMPLSQEARRATVTHAPHTQAGPETLSKGDELLRCGFKPSPEWCDEADTKSLLPYGTHLFDFVGRKFARPLLARNDIEIGQTADARRRRRAMRGSVYRRTATPKVVKQTQMLNNACEMTSTLLLHPYESKLFVVDERNCITTWDYSDGSQVQHLENLVRDGNNVTALARTSSQAEPLLFVGTDDGTVRVWTSVGEASKTPQLLSAFHAVPDINLSRRGRPGGWKPLVMDWQETRGSIAAAGPPQDGCEVKVKLWDMKAHVCWAEVPVASEFPVTTLHGCGQEDILWAGCGDGSVHLIDTRSPASVGLVSHSRATGQGKMAPLLRIQLVNGQQAAASSVTSSQIVSATSGGTVMLWDPRNASRPMQMLDTGFPMTAFAAHPYSHKIACGSHKRFVKIYSLEGKQLTSIEHHQGFFGQRIGPVSTIEFHPTGPIMAFGAVDPFVYVGES